VKPYEFSFEFCAALPDLEDAEIAMDRIVAYAESIGLIFGGGHAGQMPREHIVAGSPLARALDGAR
jgi:hypothetical protein